MQISALNTIIAAQQARGAAPAPTASRKAPEVSPDFQPLAFASPQAETAPAPPAYPANAPLGSQVDIRV